MSFSFSLILLIGAILTFVLILRKIRCSEVTIADSTFWFLFASGLVVMGLFPQISFFFAEQLDVQSPANFVFMSIIAVLVLREFYTTIEVSQLRAKVRILIQNEALNDLEERRDEK